MADDTRPSNYRPRSSNRDEGWKLIKGKVKIGDSVKYEVDARNILKEIMIDGEVYRTNIRKKWSK